MFDNLAEEVVIHDLTEKQYPEVIISFVHFLGGEVQLEQGSTPGFTPNDVDNDVLSMSKEQALVMAQTIIDKFKE